jgi:hypothetical protein
MTAVKQTFLEVYEYRAPLSISHLGRLKTVVKTDSVKRFYQPAEDHILRKSESQWDLSAGLSRHLFPVLNSTC